MSRPLYQRLFDHYRQQLITRKIAPGEKIDSITEIQQKHNVARETAKKVLALLAEEGYIVKRPGRGSFAVKRHNRVKTWAVILPFYSVHYREVLTELQLKAAKDGREIIHFSSNNDPKQEMRLVGQMIHQEYEAVIVIPTRDASKTNGFYRQVANENIPLIIFDFYDYEEILFNSVVQYYSMGILKGLDYLKHRKGGAIAFVGMTLWKEDNKIQELFIKRYKEFITNHDLQQPALIFDDGTPITKDVIQTHNITGILCPDDVVAIKTIGQLKECGIRVPEDVNIVSYGNTDLARYFTPAVTSIDSNYKEMVEKVVHSIQLRQAGTAAKPERIIVEPSLVIRNT